MVEGLVSITAFPSRRRFLLPSETLSKELPNLLAKLEASDMSGSEPLEHDHYIFVCCDAATDKRCGYCGPRLVDAFEAAVAKREDSKRIKVVRTSHVGGHKFAGNVIAFPAGDWFGYVTPERVDDILRASVDALNQSGRPEILPDLWRGRLGLSKEEVLGAV